MATDYVANVSDENLWLLDSAIEFALDLQSMDQPLNVSAQRLGEFVDFLIENFTLQGKPSSPVLCEDAPLVFAKAA